MNIPLIKLYWTQEDIDAVTSIIKGGRYWANGPIIDIFERKVAEYVGTKYALAFNSGTSALHAALDASGVAGSEVIVPSFTFIATPNSVIMADGIPIFCDIESISYGLNPRIVENCITDHTKAIMPIHYGGGACDISALKECAESYDLLLFEDSAEGLGVKVDGKHVGTFGEWGMFSFTDAKIISGGEGGVIVTDDYTLVDHMKRFRDHGRMGNQFVSLGYNFRMSSMTAALCLSQFNNLSYVIRERRKKAVVMNELIESDPLLENIVTPEIGSNTFQMYTIEAPNRNDLQSYLTKHGVGSKIWFSPVHDTVFYKNLGYTDVLPITREVSSKVLSLPIYPQITDDEQEYIAKMLHDFYSNHQ